MWTHVVTWWGWSIALVGLLQVGMNTGTPKLWETINVGYMPFVLVTALIIVDRVAHRWLPRLTTGSQFTDVALYGMLSYAFISVLWAAQPDSSIVYAIMWGTYGLAVFLVTTSLLVSRPRSTDILIKTIILGSVIASIAGLVRLHLNLTDFADIMPSLDRNSVGIVLTPWIPVSVALFIATRQLRFVIFALVLGLALFSIYSRTVQTGLVLVAIGVPFIVIRDLKKIVPIVLSLCLVGMAILLIYPHTPEIRTYPAVREALQIVDLWNSNILPGENDYRRANLYQAWKEIFSEHRAFGTGVGLSSYLHYFPHNSAVGIPAGPHNAYLNILAQFGLVGSGFVLAFLIGILLILYRATHLRTGVHTMHMRRAFLVGYVVVLVMLVGHQAETNPLLWLFLAIAVAVARSDIFERSPASNQRGTSSPHFSRL